MELIETHNSETSGTVFVIRETHGDGSQTEYRIRQRGKSYAQDTDYEGYTISDVYDLSEDEARKILNKATS